MDTEEYFSQFGDKLPAAITEQLAEAPCTHRCCKSRPDSFQLAHSIGGRFPQQGPPPMFFQRCFRVEDTCAFWALTWGGELAVKRWTTVNGYEWAVLSHHREIRMICGCVVWTLAYGTFNVAPGEIGAPSRAHGVHWYRAQNVQLNMPPVSSRPLRLN